MKFTEGGELCCNPLVTINRLLRCLSALITESNTSLYMAAEHAVHIGMLFNGISLDKLPSWPHSKYEQFKSSLTAWLRFSTFNYLGGIFNAIALHQECWQFNAFIKWTNSLKQIFFAPSSAMPTNCKHLLLPHYIYLRISSLINLVVILIQCLY